MHVDRDAQFQQINQTGKAFEAAGLPAISEDCKKKALLIMADRGGSNGARNRLWKMQLPQPHQTDVMNMRELLAHIAAETPSRASGTVPSRT